MAKSVATDIPIGRAAEICRAALARIASERPPKEGPPADRFAVYLQTHAREALRQWDAASLRERRAAREAAERTHAIDQQLKQMQHGRGSEVDY